MGFIKQVLIVEDDLLNLKLFRDILRAKGYQTLEDRTGKDAVRLAELRQPDLIILDVLLPHSSGIEIARTLKSKTSTKNIPIVSLTALAVTHIYQKMLQAGCCACLFKPFSLDQFLKVVDEAIKPKSMKRPNAINKTEDAPPPNFYQLEFKEAI